MEGQASNAAVEEGVDNILTAVLLGASLDREDGRAVCAIAYGLAVWQGGREDDGLAIGEEAYGEIRKIRKLGVAVGLDIELGCGAEGGADDRAHRGGRSERIAGTWRKS